MKKSTLTLLTFTALTLLVMSCSKKQDVMPESLPEINEKNLTECPAGYQCDYWYNDFPTAYSSLFSAPNPDYRLFFAQSSTTVDQKTSSMVIEAPKEARSFTLTAEDIKDGRVKIILSCPTCYAIPPKLVGGYVKGINLSPRATRSSGLDRWLIEAKIIRENLTTPVTRDSILVKQYFYPSY
jgi:hypothetical protein